MHIRPNRLRRLGRFVLDYATPAGWRRRRALAIVTRTAIGALAQLLDPEVPLAEALDSAAETLVGVLDLRPDLTRPVLAQLDGTCGLLRRHDLASLRRLSRSELSHLACAVHGIASMAAWEWAVH